jgi:hypothetical protein
MHDDFARELKLFKVSQHALFAALNGYVPRIL